MWYIILSFAAFIYVLSNFIFPQLHFVDPFIAFLLQAILWITLGVCTYYLAERQGISIWSLRKIRKWSFGNSPFQASLLLAGFHISLLIFFGVMFGFGNNQFSFSTVGILTNILFVGGILIGGEFMRSYLLHNKNRYLRSMTSSLIWITVIFVLLRLPLSAMRGTDFTSGLAIIEFLGTSILPLLSIQLLATYFAYVGGAKTSLGYIAPLMIFQWFIPIQPHLSWLITAFIATLAPAIGFVFIQSSLEPPRRIKKKKITDSLTSWTSIATVSVFLVFFSTGVFGVQPTVIYSGSMEPAIEVGDIVVIQEVSPLDLEQGDVIQFYHHNMTIIHRIHDITYEQDSIRFITKGDANDQIDSELVYPGQVMGRAVVTIPKIGWISIALKDALFQK